MATAGSPAVARAGRPALSAAVTLLYYQSQFEIGNRNSLFTPIYLQAKGIFYGVFFGAAGWLSGFTRPQEGRNKLYEGSRSGTDLAREQKAGKRLLIRLRQMFPKLRIMVVADGLYANGPIMAQCRHLHLDFMFVLPRDHLPGAWAEAQAIRKLEKDQTLKGFTAGNL